MRRFRDGEIDVLVATTVIEVGIDVPNATVMLIEHPERFGLSQLHQLRGRVGRGAEASYCILLGDVGPETQAAARHLRRHRGRLRDRATRICACAAWATCSASGRAASPTFRVADPLRDELLNEQAHVAADRLLAADPELALPANASAARRDGHALRAGAGAFSRWLDCHPAGASAASECRDLLSLPHSLSMRLAR